MTGSLRRSRRAPKTHTGYNVEDIVEVSSIIAGDRCAGTSRDTMARAADSLLGDTVNSTYNHTNVTESRLHVLLSLD